MIKDPLTATMTEAHQREMNALKASLKADYRENKIILDGHYDQSLAVRCTNGMGPRIECDGKQAVLDFMADYIRRNPGEKRYRFNMEKRF